VAANWRRSADAQWQRGIIEVTPGYIKALATLIESSDMVVLHIGDKKAALGKDVQEAIVAALKKEATS